MGLFYMNICWEDLVRPQLYLNDARHAWADPLDPRVPLVHDGGDELVEDLMLSSSLSIV